MALRQLPITARSVKRDAGGQLLRGGIVVQRSVRRGRSTSAPTCSRRRGESTKRVAAGLDLVTGPRQHVREEVLAKRQSIVGPRSRTRRAGPSRCGATTSPLLPPPARRTSSRSRRSRHSACSRSSSGSPSGESSASSPSCSGNGSSPSRCWSGGEEEDQLADGEIRGIDLRQHFGEPKRVRGQRVPGSRWPTRVEPGQP